MPAICSPERIWRAEWPVDSGKTAHHGPSDCCFLTRSKGRINKYSTSPSIFLVARKKRFRSLERAVNVLLLLLERAQQCRSQKTILEELTKWRKHGADRRGTFRESIRCNQRFVIKCVTADPFLARQRPSSTVFSVVGFN